jgi:organic radical activating enzyme
MYDLTYLCDAIHELNVEIAIETSGAHPLIGDIDWICLSPKKFKLPLEENYLQANELKVIVFNRHDFKWANELMDKVNLACQLYLQPEWNKKEEMIPEIVDFVKNNVDWNISLQTHKYLGVE